MYVDDESRRREGGDDWLWSSSFVNIGSGFALSTFCRGNGPGNNLLVHDDEGRDTGNPVIRTLIRGTGDSTSPISLLGKLL